MNAMLKATQKEEMVEIDHALLSTNTRENLIIDIIIK